MATCPSCRKRYPDDDKTCASDGEALLPDEAFASAEGDLEAGQKIGEYVVEAKIGEGGFGSVYRAVHPLIGKRAAVKVLNRQYSSNPQMVSRFIAEARAVNQIKNRFIIDIFSFGALPDGRQYYVMELLDGMPLDAYLKQRGGSPPKRHSRSSAGSPRRSTPRTPTTSRTAISSPRTSSWSSRKTGRRSRSSWISGSRSSSVSLRPSTRRAPARRWERPRTCRPSNVAARTSAI
jgi:hypothetical protein